MDTSLEHRGPGLKATLKTAALIPLYQGRLTHVMRQFTSPPPDNSLVIRLTSWKRWQQSSSSHRCHWKEQSRHSSLSLH